jgi:hypothetical protein
MMRRRVGIVHFMTYRVLENCLVFMQTSRLCHTEKSVRLDSLDFVHSDECLRWCVAVAICFVDLRGG